MEKDAWYHKTVTFRAWKQSLNFYTSLQLFSSHDVDTGTKFLLRSIVEAGYGDFKRILDVGCGYGPLGLTLKNLYPNSTVHLLDKDALAVAYSRQNAVLNELNNVQVYGSLGYDDVPETGFDLIVSNIPDHAGETIITYLLREARYYLAPGGTAAVVVVTPLEELAAKILADTPGAEVILKRNRPGHAVLHYRFNDSAAPPKPGLSSFERGIYYRQKAVIRLENLEYAVQTAYGLPEFDSLNFAGKMLINALFSLQNRSFNRVVVLNPGQGHTPVAVWKLLHPRTVTLVDRDLLALRYARLNLIANGCPPEHISLSHQVGTGAVSVEKADLITGVLREEEGKDATFLTLDGAAVQTCPGGTVILAAGSTAITRLADYVMSQKTLRIKSRERWRGYSLLALEKA
jgi:16S rRNA (guanine1207-N2)-methyltransferase